MEFYLVGTSHTWGRVIASLSPCSMLNMYLIASPMRECWSVCCRVDAEWENGYGDVVGAAVRRDLVGACVVSSSAVVIANLSPSSITIRDRRLSLEFILIVAS